MSSSSTTAKDDMSSSIKIVPFSGDRAKYWEWEFEWLAYARAKGFHKVMVRKEKVPAVDKTNKTAEELKAKEANDYGYAQLVLSVSGSAFFHVGDAKTKELPDGDLALAYEKLQEVYAPKGRSGLVELTMQFNNCALESTRVDPEEWYDKLEYMRKRLKTMGSVISDDDLIAHMLAKLPYKYSELVTTTMLLLDSGDKYTVTAETLKKSIRTFWRRRFEKQQDKGTPLFPGKKFKGCCHKCGKFGHKATDCRSDGNENKQNNENSGGSGKGNDTRKCYNCNEIGHISGNCPKKSKGENDSIH